jgi:hypothetical protein
VLSDYGGSSVVVITADQDWAPEWAAGVFINAVEDLQIPVHCFRTNKTKSIDDAQGRGVITNGWHPNFKPFSSHGKDYAEVIDTMTSMFPDCTTVRCHSYFESTEIWQLLFKAGIRFESHGNTNLENNIRPIKMMTGLTRLPVFFEDDCYMPLVRDEINPRRLISGLVQPGLKVLDFHPIHVAMNTPNMKFYLDNKDSVYKEQVVTEDSLFGVRNLFEEVVEYCRSNSIPIVSFLELADSAMVD